MTDEDMRQAVRQHEVQMADLLRTLDLLPGATEAAGAVAVAPIVVALNDSLRGLERQLTRELGRA